jgi:hypothetical protein
MKTFTLINDGDRDVRFTGELLGKVTSERPEGSDRWTELALYRTKEGFYVTEEIGRTRWQGEYDKHTVYTCDDTIETVFEVLGGGWLAKSLYKKLGIDYVREIE